MRIWAMTVGALVLLMVPLASASPVSGVSWSSADPLALRGDVSVDARNGIGQLDDPHAQGSLGLDLANGTITISSWRNARLDAPSELGGFAPPIESAQNRDFRILATRLVVRLADEPLQLTLVAREDGVVSVQGAADARGFPVRLAHDYAGYPADSAVPSDALPIRPPPYVDWTWKEGWLFCGAYPGAADRGFPGLAQPTMRAQGPVDLMVLGGTASFRDENGTLQTIRLGEAADDSSPSSPGVAIQRQTRLVFHGEARDASIVPSGSWGVAGPEVAWRVHGGVEAQRATGEYRDARGSHAFADRTIQATGDLALAPDASRAVTALSPPSYDASGRFDSLVVDGARVVQPSPAPSLAAPAVELTLLGALLLALTSAGRELLGKAAAPLYTRLAPTTLLDHDARRKLHDLAREAPGIHLGDAARRAGLARGTLRFHAGMLAKAGFLRLERQGGHVRLFPVNVASSQAAPILHPVAQRILASLPGDGAPLDVRELRSKVGASRQLLSYHLNKLAALEQVRLVGSRPTMVARAAAALEAAP